MNQKNPISYKSKLLLSTLNLYRKIVYIGSEKLTNSDDLRRHLLANLLFIVSSIAFIALGLSNYFYGFYKASILEFVTAALILFQFSFQRNPLNRFKVNSLFYLFHVNLILYDYFLDLQETNLPYVGVILLNITVMFYNMSKIDMWIHILITILIQVIMPFTIKHPDHLLVSEEIIRNSFIVNTFFSCVLYVTLMLTFLKFWDNNKMELNKKIDEKEVLLAEVNHRVRNNLNIIISLLKLQQISLTNEEGIQAIEESKQRVFSMATVHNKLYHSKDLKSIDFNEYVSELANEISLTSQKDYSINILSGNIQVNVSKAIPLGLILTELFTNTYKHAEPKSNGSITIEVSKHDEEIQLSYKDNGSNFNLDSIMQNKDSLGITLIESLSEQISGSFKFSEDNGFRYDLKFNLN